MTKNLESYFHRTGKERPKFSEFSMRDETLDVQPSHHDINVNKERSSSTLEKDSSQDPLYAFPTTSGTFHSTLTKSETCASILAYSFKLCSTYSAMQDLLELIDLILPSPNHLPKSVFFVKKALTPDDLTQSAVYHQFCSGCFQILNDFEVVCETCGR